MEFDESIGYINSNDGTTLPEDSLIAYLGSASVSPFFQGDALSVLGGFPSNSIDMAISSPPYYMKREYLAGEI